MIMLCTNENKKELLDFLLRKPTENCFFIGDIENFNLDDEFIDVWKIETNGQISSVLLRYYKFYLISSENENDLKQIAQIIELDKECISVSGLEQTIDKIAEYLDFIKIKKTFLAELNKKTFNTITSKLSPKKATNSDIEELFEFQKSIEEFSLDERHRESFGKEITSNTGKIYYIRDKDQIVSSATITAENSINGTIIGVATNPNYRNQGYAQTCVAEICKEMIENSKTVVLFYDNPNAGKLYKKIGFQDVGKWSIGTIR